MRFSLPHDHGGSPCLPSYHPRSHRVLTRCAMPTRSSKPRLRTCSPTWPASPTREPLVGAATHWSPSWPWPPPRCLPSPARCPRSPNGPPRPPSQSVPRSAPATTLPATTASRPKPPSAGPWAAWTPKPWPQRSAPGFATATASSGSGGGQSRSMARRCEAPNTTAARSTCWPRWTTPPAVCWPNTRSTAPPARSPPSNPCWSRWTLPGRSSPPTRCTPTPTPPSSWSAKSRPTTYWSSRPTSPPCWNAAPPWPGTTSLSPTAPATAATAGWRSAPSRPSPSATSAPARRPGHPGHPQGLRPCHPQVAHRGRLRHHQPVVPAGPPARLADLIRGHWTLANALHWVRDVTLGEDASQLRRWHRPAGHGQPAQLGDRCAQPGWAGQPRRRTTPPRPRPCPERTAGDLFCHPLKDLRACEILIVRHYFSLRFDTLILANPSAAGTPRMRSSSYPRPLIE